jgi:hypothetical protein
MHRGLTLSVVVAVALAAAVAAQRPSVNTGRGGLALKGYDAVAYFTDGKPVKGSGQFEHRWNGAVWRFARATHLEAFAKEPEKYAPRFGGYCAWAVSHGYTADGDPYAWKIVGGRLYLNYFRSVQRQWEQNIPKYIADGEANWPRVLGAASR